MAKRAPKDATRVPVVNDYGALHGKIIRHVSKREAEALLAEGQAKIATDQKGGHFLQLIPQQVKDSKSSPCSMTASEIARYAMIRKETMTPSEAELSAKVAAFKPRLTATITRVDGWDEIQGNVVTFNA